MREASDKNYVTTKLLEEAAQIFLLPPNRSTVMTEFFLPSKKAFVVNDTAPSAVVFIGNKSVEHFVKDDVFDIPAWNELTIEQGVNTDEPILLLNTSEYDVAFRFLPTTASPRDSVVAQTISEIAAVDAIKDHTQIEMPSLRAEFKLPLHCTVRHQRVTFSHGFVRGFPLRCLGLSFSHGRKLLLQLSQRFRCHKRSHFGG